MHVAKWSSLSRVLVLLWRLLLQQYANNYIVCKQENTTWRIIFGSCTRKATLNVPLMTATLFQNFANHFSIMHSLLFWISLRSLCVRRVSLSERLTLSPSHALPLSIWWSKILSNKIPIEYHLLRFTTTTNNAVPLSIYLVRLPNWQMRTVLLIVVLTLRFSCLLYGLF